MTTEIFNKVKGINIENAMVNENKEELEKLLKIWDLGVDN